jgi:RimJ/RimL family protein N-acetyltransferase
VIETERLILRAFRDEDREAFAAINADPRVADWLGGVRDRAASDDLVDRINANIARLGYDFWAAERKADGAVIGMIGLRMELHDPPAPCVEMGWRLAVEAQGQGLATEGARAALGWGFANLDADEILAWTADSNVASQAVMRRIGMTPDPSRDFDHPRLAEDHPLRRHVVFAARRGAI